MNGSPKKLCLYILPCMHDNLRLNGILPDKRIAVFLTSSSTMGCTNGYLYEYDAARQKKGDTKLTRWVPDVMSWRELANETTSVADAYAAILRAMNGFNP